MTDIPTAPDAKTWEFYQGILGALPWQWAPDPGQAETRRALQSGMLTASFTQLPHGGDLKELKAVLKWLLDLQEDPPHITSGNTTTLSVRCKQRDPDFANHIGLNLDAPPVRRKKWAFTAAPSLPVRLSDALFYRSHGDGALLYAFVPEGTNTDAFKALLKTERINVTATSQQIGKGGRKGIRLTIDPQSAARLEKLGISIAPNPHTAIPSREGRSA